MTDVPSTGFANLLKRDSLVVVAALALITILAWAYLLTLNGDMQTSVASGQMHPAMPGMGEMSGMASGQSTAMAHALTPWTPTHFLFTFAMWAVMMIGMMTPSVSPMVLIYSRLAKTAAAQGTPFASSAWFTGGYLVAWTWFALSASVAQYALDRAALLTPMMALQSRTFGGAVLTAAGLYQWLPVKGVCLSNCRAPLAFVQRHGGFSAGALGSVKLGALHGLYCIGCCWAMMLLLFVAGVMNLFWIAALMLIVLTEKLVPGAAYVSRAVGAIAIGAGLWLLGT